MKNIFCILGPTACGKTNLAIELAQQAPVEIISVDSAMVYRNMDIGTAKPTAEELAIAPHRLIDICDPADSYSVGQFCIDAIKEIEAVLANGNIPLLVGGTMLYFYMLQQSLSELPATDEAIREQVAQEAEKIGWTAMHAKLAKVDPASASRIEANDPQRIGRALELYEMTGQTMTELMAQQTKQALPYTFQNIMLVEPDRAALHARIEQRFDLMLQQGFEQEARALYQRSDLDINLSSMRCVGYKQMWQYFEGELSKESMREKAIVATRQLAKRQCTWLRNSSWQNKTEMTVGEKSNLETVLRRLTAGRKP